MWSFRRLSIWSEPRKLRLRSFSVPRRDQMNSHKNAPLTPKGREAMVRCVEAGLSNAAAARQFNTTPKTVAKWVERFRAGGVDGLRDRSSRPLSLPSQTAPATCAVVEVLRRQRHTGKQIAAEVGVSAATVSRILRRLGLNRIRDLEPAEPVRRYEREKPGEMIHIDIKKLGRFDKIGHRITGDRTGQSNGRGVGWEFVHVCIDDHSRVAFSQILPDEKAESAVPFLKAAVAYYKSLGVTVTRVMTDNGSCYKAFDFRDACRDLGIKHIRTKPYTPKTNGKAERFIQTALREWAYAQAYPTSDRRAEELPLWIHKYNWHRPHGALKSQTPISRLGLTEDNLLRLHS
jgi:transposase InsO family protein